MTKGEKFLSEYEKLCEKHGFRITVAPVLVSDGKGGYVIRVNSTLVETKKKKEKGRVK